MYSENTVWTEGIGSSEQFLGGERRANRTRPLNALEYDQKDRRSAHAAKQDAVRDLRDAERVYRDELRLQPHDGWALRGLALTRDSPLPTVPSTRAS